MPQYHITLNGQGYLVDLRRYRKTAGDAFVARRATGPLSYADLRDISTWAQTTWAEGHAPTPAPADPAPPARFARAQALDTLTPAALRLAPQAVPIPAWDPTPAAPRIHGFLPYRGALFWATAQGGTLTLYRAETEALPPAAFTRAEAAVGGLAVFRNAVWVGAGTTGAVHRWDAGSGTFTTPFTFAGGQGVPALAVYTPSGTTPALYLGVKLEAGAQLHVTTDGATSSLLLTLDYAEPTYLFVFDGALFVAVADAGGHGLLYRYDGSRWSEVLRLSENWIQAGAPFAGAYYLASGRDNRLWRFDGRALTEVLAGHTPSGSRVRALLPFAGRLYAGLEWAGGAPVRTLAASRTGADWHDLRPQGLAPAGRGVHALGALAGTLYLGEELASGTGARVYRLGGALNPSGTLTTLPLDAGLPALPKAWRRLRAAHLPLAAGESVALAYRLDQTGSFTPLVTNSTAGSTETSGTLPDGTTSRTLELQLTLAGGGTSSPTVTALLAEYALRPGVRRAWELEVLLEGTPRAPLRRLDGTPEPLAGAQLSAALWAARAAAAPVPYVDLDGAAYRVWVAEVEEHVAPLPPRDGWQTRARVRLVEA
ncbi:MAG TPA: hypothetical protein VFB73_09375 [Chloroflexota bacterium]|nr:hypothetical protein [Chloroflexota bacterium]